MVLEVNGLLSLMKVFVHCLFEKVVRFNILKYWITVN